MLKKSKLLGKILRIICPIWLLWCYVFALALAQRGHTGAAAITGGTFVWMAFITWAVYRP